MDRDKILIMADHTGRFYAERYGFPPVAGRLIGYLYVCQPAEQSVNDIAKTLLTSRSAINGAVKTLEIQRLVKRSRPAGMRADLISLAPLGRENMGFDPTEYQQMASLAREGLELTVDDSSGRRESLEAVVSLNEFMVERLPQLYEEWVMRHKKFQESKKMGVNHEISGNS
ncbi:MAG TPA: helix-turn-helix domain-containing protein [Candidatus Saccharimonadales bacterium]|nr:helix-turn-helix domain-containing protein [Candidatus Saccharimonadales bacterium]